MLTATGVYKSYGRLPVLKGVDLHIERGEVVAVVGASGAGKSTLLHVLGTLSTLDKGEVCINGIDISKRGAGQLARFRNRNIGFVFQFHNLLPEFSALENIMIPGLIAGDTEKAVKERARNLMKRLGLVGCRDNKPSQMSGGEQQRTAVARALINTPALIFADEPSGNLDSKNANALHRLFFELKRDLGHTFVIVTHNEKLAAMADRKLEIRDGVIYGKP